MKVQGKFKVSMESIIRRIIYFPSIAGGVLMVALMLLIVTDVLLRNIFSTPIIGTLEVSMFIMLCVGSLATAWCALNGKHIQVDLVVSHLSPGVKEIINIINLLIVGGVSFFIAFESFARAFFVRELGHSSEMLNIPLFPFYLLLSFSFWLLVLVTMLLLIKSILRLVKR